MTEALRMCRDSSFDCELSNRSVCACVVSPLLQGLREKSLVFGATLSSLPANYLQIADIDSKSKGAT